MGPWLRTALPQTLTAHSLDGCALCAHTRTARGLVHVGDVRVCFVRVSVWCVCAMCGWVDAAGANATLVLEGEVYYNYPAGHITMEIWELDVTVRDHLPPAEPLWMRVLRHCLWEGVGAMCVV